MQVPIEVSRWKELAEKYAAFYSSILDPDEILAIIWTESWGNPAKINPNDPSYGLMQVMMASGTTHRAVPLPCLAAPQY